MNDELNIELDYFPTNLQEDFSEYGIGIGPDECLMTGLESITGEVFTERIDSDSFSDDMPFDYHKELSLEIFKPQRRILWLEQ